MRLLINICHFQASDILVVGLVIKLIMIIYWYRDLMQYVLLHNHIVCLSLYKYINISTTIEQIITAYWCNGVMVSWCHGVMVSQCNGVMV